MAKRKKSKTEKYKYRIDIIWSSEDDCYVVNVPELEGCMTHGETLDEAAAMAEEAISCYLESLEKKGIPAPIPISEKNFSGKIAIRIDPNLHRDLSLKAQLEGQSLNKFIESKLKKSS